ncbi:unnamed protein product [Lymnaea stagnalis]|uniref:C1q domain-containing protein n=1 Tax=Lymnaea stagnalis TaxID=6523 RepID=A0AAV2IEW0_LYMST
MASNAQPQEIFESYIRQQLEVLQEKREDVSTAADNYIDRVHMDVANWLSGDQVNQTTFEGLSNRIQQAVTFFVTKSVEFAGPLNNVIEDDASQIPLPHACVSNSSQTERTSTSEEFIRKKIGEQVENFSKIMTARFTILEEAVLSLKRTTEQVQEKQENVNKKLEILTKVEAIDTELAKISRKVAQIESKVNHPTILFNACKKLNPSLGCYVDKFDDVSTNFGSHFDQSSGEFTAPLDGFYLISINIFGIPEGSFNIECIQKVKNMQFTFGHSRKLCCVSDNECVTCLVSLTAGDKLVLRLETKVVTPFSFIKIEFSCFMIKN